MGTGFLFFLQKWWPFYSPKYDDIRISEEIVGKLPIPDETKQFVFAIKEPESQSIIYILASQNLSKQSALDTESLIKEIRPEAVIAQVSPSALSDILTDEKSNLEDGNSNPGISVPTSSLGVLVGCFLNKINKDRYDSLAGSEIVNKIFGVGFYEHFLAANKVAKEVGSSFLLLESPFVSTTGDDDSNCGSEEVVGENKFQALGPYSSSLVPHKIVSAVSAGSKRLLLTSDHHSQMVRSMSSSVSLSASKLCPIDNGLGDCQPIRDYQAPVYALPVYSLLTDLHDIFADLPSMGRALAYAQKMFHNVDKGEAVDTRLLSEVCVFQVAVEGLRVGLNRAGRCPFNQKEKLQSSNTGYSELSTEEKSQALFAQALRCQMKKFKSIVAVVDASSLAGLRKHWGTPVPKEVEALVEEFFTEQGNANTNSDNVDKKNLLGNKSVVAVGAGATAAAIGVSSLSKVGHASTFMKLVAYKVPASLKLSLLETYRTMAIGLSKTVGTSKVVIPGLGSSGAKTTSILKASASTEKIRSVAHSIIASAERTSFSAMRTSFYEIMRSRRVQPIRSMPLATLGCSMVTCAGLLMYGDHFEYAAEAVPVAPRIASLGRGLQNLRQASLSMVDSTNTREAMNSLLYSSNKEKVK